MSIQEILESAGLPAQRGVYTGRDKPDAYYTFLRLLGTPAVNADDEEKERREMYRVSNLLRVVQEQQETIEKQSRLIADLIATLESWEQTAGYDGEELKERAKDLQLRERRDL